MKTCIYCDTEKDDNEFSLEHIIPQFLGGAYAPDKFKTRNVCKKCNNNLGLFVDASFEKTFLVYNFLNEAAHAFFDPQNPANVGLPLRCMGISKNLNPPHMEEMEICETWLGPKGEQVYWIRPHDESLYWYSGGNPRTTKSKKTRAYFLFSQNSEKNIVLPLAAFRDAFKGRKVKKLMCKHIVDSDSLEILRNIGFSEELDDIDQARIDYFNQVRSQTLTDTSEISFYTRFDLRFLAKIAVGIAYAVFGEKILYTEYMKELRNALWFKEGNEIPAVKSSPAFSENGDDTLILGEKHAVTITVKSSKEGVRVNLNIGMQLNWIVKCADMNDLTQEDINNNLGDGICLVLFEPLKKCVSLTYPEFLAHKTGDQPHPELVEIANKVSHGKELVSD